MVTLDPLNVNAFIESCHIQTLELRPDTGYVARRPRRLLPTRGDDGDDLGGAGPEEQWQANREAALVRAEDLGGVTSLVELGGVATAGGSDPLALTPALTPRTPVPARPGVRLVGKRAVAADVTPNEPSPKRRRLGAKTPQSPACLQTPPRLAATLHAGTPPPQDACDAEASKALQEFRGLRLVVNKRNKWCCLWVQTRPDGFFHKSTAYRAKKVMAFEKWAKASNEEREKEWVAMAKVANVRDRGPPAENKNAAKPDSQEHKATAVMVCWNAEPCHDPAFVVLFREVQQKDPEDVAYDVLMEKVKNLPVVRTAWMNFRRFLENLRKDSIWKEESACMELSLHADEPRWHFHVTLTNIHQHRANSGYSFVSVPKAALQEFALHPRVHVTHARGRASEAAVQRLHCYVQWPKIGSVQVETNYRRGAEFCCRASWTLGIWQIRKLSYRMARAEIIANRDGVEPALAKMQAAWSAEIEEYMRRRKAEAISAVEENLKTFKEVFEVELWKDTYSRSIFNGGNETRFKFLVLEGPSRFGKTRFACSLFGMANTFLCQCQGVSQPSLTAYDPRVHKCIVLDEPSRDLVDHCKVFLQASLEGTELFQSPTQRFTRWVWVYGVPIIVCTNEWLKEEDDDANAVWIRENQVHVKVGSQLWRD